MGVTSSSYANIFQGMTFWAIAWSFMFFDYVVFDLLFNIIETDEGIVDTYPS